MNKKTEDKKIVKNTKLESVKTEKVSTFFLLYLTQYPDYLDFLDFYYSKHLVKS